VRKFNFTPEERQAALERRIKAIQSMSLEFQLGCYVGDYIVDKYLPTLDVNMLRSKHVINVGAEEKLKYEKLHADWYRKYNETKEDKSPEWDELMTFRKELKKKYLPHTLDCFVAPLNVKNMKDFKRGIMRSLWDCDMCSYKAGSVDDIIVEMEDNYFSSIIKLTLDYD
jgi:hypothetical protein